MRSQVNGAILALVVLAGAVPASGQAVETLAPTGDDEDFAAMQRRIVGVVEALIDYTHDVRLTEDGLEAVLEHHASLEDVYADGGGSRLVERAFVDGRYDFGTVVADPAYLSWCRDRDLDPESFFRDFLRLQALRMRGESLAGLDEAREGMPAQRAGLEQAREQIGEEQYARALASLESAVALSLIHI